MFCQSNSLITAATQVLPQMMVATPMRAMLITIMRASCIILYGILSSGDGFDTEDLAAKSLIDSRQTPSAGNIKQVMDMRNCWRKSPHRQ